MVDGPGHDVLAGARLPAHQHGDVGPGDELDGVANLPHAGTRPQRLLLFQLGQINQSRSASAALKDGQRGLPRVLFSELRRSQAQVGSQQFSDLVGVRLLPRRTGQTAERWRASSKSSSVKGSRMRRATPRSRAVAARPRAAQRGSVAVRLPIDRHLLPRFQLGRSGCVMRSGNLLPFVCTQPGKSCR